MREPVRLRLCDGGSAGVSVIPGCLAGYHQLIAPLKRTRTNLAPLLILTFHTSTHQLLPLDVSLGSSSSTTTTMSGPYDSYGGHQYNQPQGHNPYPAQGYGQQQPPQHQGYPQQPYYPSQDGGYHDQGFAPPARTNSFGPPQHGGFQMGIQGQQYGAYDASNPQGNSGY